MANYTERKGTLSRLGVWWTAFLLIGLLQACVWDGDGNPDTDNIPPTTVTLAPRGVRTAEEQITGGEDEDSSDELPKPTLRPRHHRFPLRELFWRRVAVPSRGPPEGGCDGKP